ncbi:UDP-glucose 4-epimerase [Brucella endophytica]|uniref:UDP-glucose 4-epimerase n=1 Tax=Brucella endophytica TaxID=1963359 RepID=A0A916SMU8_9HYPH|nr:NAD-dependent epimerase/dehydratase family protein [Brucella endophytica]GGB08325.1 UDP-glucose 4-epimerase [Brucella endophytica]
MKSSENAKLAVTGASGFIGRAVLDEFSRQGIEARGISRGPAPGWVNSATQWAQVSSYADTEAMASALSGAQFVLHLADNPQRDTARGVGNAAAAANALGEAARRTSVQGIIFASSVYARMEEAGNSYGEGKRKAEEALLADGSIPTVVLRLPPVYGDGGRGGLNTLAALVRRGLPLPLGSANEPRNYLSRRNFIDLVRNMTAAGSDSWRQANGRIFEPSDASPISTRNLIIEMGKVMGKPARLLPVPVGLLRLAGKLAARQALVSGAIDGLAVESNTGLTNLFGWQPAEQMPQSLSFLMP